MNSLIFHLLHTYNDHESYQAFYPSHTNRVKFNRGLFKVNFDGSAQDNKTSWFCYQKQYCAFIKAHSILITFISISETEIRN